MKYDTVMPTILAFEAHSVQIYIPYNIGYWEYNKIFYLYIIIPSCIYLYYILWISIDMFIMTMHGKITCNFFLPPYPVLIRN